MSIIVSLIVCALFGYWGYNVAPKKNRDQKLWAGACFFLPLISIITLYVANPADSPSNDKLGKIMLGIGVVLCVLGFIGGCVGGMASAL